MTLISKRPFALIAAALVLVAAAAVVLYVIPSARVHAGNKPQALSALVAEPKPVAAPAVAFADRAGKAHMLSEFRGRYVLLNLWATWCGPCVKELPALAKLQGSVPAGLVVLPVNVGRSTAAETESFLASHDAARLGVYVDNNLALMRAMHVYGLPVTVLIDPQGRVVDRADGPADWDAPEAVAWFKALAGLHDAS